MKFMSERDCSMIHSAKRLSWLPFLEDDLPEDLHTPVDIARFELNQAFSALAYDAAYDLSVIPALQEGWRVWKDGSLYHLEGGDTGILYGAYRLLMALAAGQPLPESTQAPRYGLRMINCWDNAEGSVERGYSGRSLFFEGGRLDYDPARMRQLGRLLASVGLNVLCINNVNVHDPAHLLIEDWLPQVADLASIFRPFGVRLMLSIDFIIQRISGRNTVPHGLRKVYGKHQPDAKGTEDGR